jgi:hypothetical protein
VLICGGGGGGGDRGNSGRKGEMKIVSMKKSKRGTILAVCINR